MSTHASVRLLLPAIGLCALCGCDAARSTLDNVLATPHRVIEGMRDCSRKRVSEHAENCEPVRAGQRGGEAEAGVATATPGAMDAASGALESMPADAN